MSKLLKGLFICLAIVFVGAVVVVGIKLSKGFGSLVHTSSIYVEEGVEGTVEATYKVVKRGTDNVVSTGEMCDANKKTGELSLNNSNGKTLDMYLKETELPLSAENDVVFTYKFKGGKRFSAEVEYLDESKETKNIDFSYSYNGGEYTKESDGMPFTVEKGNEVTYSVRLSRTGASEDTYLSGVFKWNLKKLAPKVELAFTNATGSSVSSSNVYIKMSEDKSRFKIVGAVPKAEAVETDKTNGYLTVDEMKNSGSAEFYGFYASTEPIEEGQYPFVGATSIYYTSTLDETIENWYEALTEDTTLYACFMVPNYTGGVYSESEKQIVISNSITSIPSNAFYHQTEITDVVIPNSVTTIGSTAFSDCEGLTSVVILNGMQAIESNAFQNCYRLVEVINKSNLDITIGSTGNGSIASNALAVHDGSGGSIVSKEDDYQFATINGTNYLLGYTGTETDLVFPNDYKGESYVVNVRAFFRCNWITSVETGNGVTEIGFGSFEECNNLRQVIIGDGVTKIGIHAFDHCERLSKVTMGNSVNEIETCAFQSCDNLISVNIPKSMQIIRDSAFSGCFKMVEVMNKSIMDIKKGSDSYGCVGKYALIVHREDESKIVTTEDGLQFITVDGTNYLLEYTGLKTKLILPDNYNGEDYELYLWAFYRHGEITSVTIGRGVTAIGVSAFYGCKNLVEVINKSSLSITKGGTDNGYVGYYALTVHNDDQSKIVTTADGFQFITVDGTNYLLGYTGTEKELTLPDNYNGGNYEIYTYAFYQCYGLTKVTIPGGVTTIGRSAFYGCDRLKSVTMSSGLQVIASEAFYHCTRLTNLTIPDSVTTIGYSAFYECTSLTSITIPNSVTTIGYGAFRNCGGITSATVGNGVATLEGQTFSGCSALASVTIGSSVTTIGSQVFAACFELKNVTILGSVTEIGESAFSSCRKLANITIPDSVTAIGADAFHSCGALKSIAIPDSVTVINEETFAYCSSLESVTMGRGVTKISRDVFYKCLELAKVTIPEGVTEIGVRAFRSCWKLTNITIPSSVTTIGEWAFYDCKNLVEVINKSSLSITKGGTDNGYVGYYALTVHNDDQSKIVTTADGFQFIAVDGTNYLLGYTGTETELTLPGNYNGENYEIYKEAFYQCYGLTKVTIGSGVKKIGQKAFWKCTNLASITIGASVEQIGSSAFYGCESLEEVCIPQSVTSIGKSAFGACWTLTKVVFEDVEKEWTVNGMSVTVSDAETNANRLVNGSQYSSWEWTKNS